MPYTAQPLDASTWDAFAELVERNNGIYGGCWCIAFQSAYQRGVSDPRTLKEQLVRAGQAHAALVVDEQGLVQGWCQYGSPDELDLRHVREYHKDPPPPARWRITCIFVDKGHRGQGVARAGLEGALTQIAASGGGLVEAISETTAGRVAQSRFLFSATAELFEQFGFARGRQVGKHARGQRVGMVGALRALTCVVGLLVERYRGCGHPGAVACRRQVPERCEGEVSMGQAAARGHALGVITAERSLQFRDADLERGDGVLRPSCGLARGGEVFTGQLIVKAGAVVFVLALNKTFSINLQLLGGIWVLQTFPSIVAGLYTRWFHRWALIAGWAAAMVYGTIEAYRQPGGGQAHFGASPPLKSATPRWRSISRARWRAWTRRAAARPRPSFAPSTGGWP